MSEGAQGISCHSHYYPLLRWTDVRERNPLGLCCLTGLSAAVEMACICPVHYGSHQPQVAMQYLGEGIELSFKFWFS